MYELIQFDEKPRMTEGEGSVREEFTSEWQLSLVLRLAKSSLVIIWYTAEQEDWKH